MPLLQQDKEELRKDFSPKSLTVTKLPNSREVIDNTLVILKQSGTKKLYIMSEGKWNLIGTLTEV